MGKAKKAKVVAEGSKNVPLAQQIDEDRAVRAPGRTKVRNRLDNDEEVTIFKCFLHKLQYTVNTQCDQEKSGMIIHSDSVHVIVCNA